MNLENMQTVFKTSFNIRLCSEEDLPRVCSVETKSFSDPYPRYLIEELYDRFGDLFVVAEKNSEIIGYVIAEVAGDEGHVVSVAVLELYRRRGVAKALMNSVLQRIAQRRVRKVSLQVSVNNQLAISLYEKVGFEKVMVLSNYYSDGNDAFLMSKEIETAG